MRKGIFRKSALDKISSLDQLDLAMTVVKPAEIIAASAVGILLVAVLLWAFLGSVPERVMGTGVFADVSSMQSVKSSGQGVLKDVFVERNDYVKKGQVIARIERQDLLDQLNIQNHKLEELEKMRATLVTQSKNGQSRQNAMRQLYEQGLITESEYVNSRQTEANLTQQINDTRQQIVVSNETYQTSTQIVSNVSGYVKEIPAKKGDYIQAGTSIIIVGKNENDNVVQAIVYFPAKDGKKIKPGMRIGVSPSTVKQEEYGYMEGIVTDISTYPVSDQYLVSSLQNTTLVENFRRIENPIEVVVSLIPNPDTYSGFKWSSSKGPTEKITAGIICGGVVTVADKKPIELVIPFLRKALFGIGDDEK